MILNWKKVISDLRLDYVVKEYNKAIDALTIDPANRLRKKVEKLEVEASQLQRLQAACYSSRTEDKIKRYYRAKGNNRSHIGARNYIYFAIQPFHMSIILQIPAIPLKCQRCLHIWNYKGKNSYVATCPYCRTYVTIKKHAIRSEQVLGGAAHPISRTRGPKTNG